MPLLIDFINRQFIHHPPRVHTSFKCQTIIVTGGSSGLGLSASRQLLELGASRVIIACRNLTKGKAAAADIQASTSCGADVIQVWHLDMSSYASVVAFSEKVKAELPRLDAVIANAGVMNRKFLMTEDNEEMITTNVVSTALLACLLHSKMFESATKFNVYTHFTVVGSELYEFVKFKELDAPEGQLFAMLGDEGLKPDMADRYNVSKLLVLLFVRQMADMVPVGNSGVVVNCVAPGFCASDLSRDYGNGVVIRFLVKILARPTDVGARTLVHGASVDKKSHGQYLPDCKITETKGMTNGEKGKKLQERVWLELRDKLETIRSGVTSLGM